MFELVDIEKTLARFVRRTNWGAVCYGIAVLLFICIMGTLNAADSSSLWWVWLLGEALGTAFFMALGARETERYRYREMMRRNEAFEKRRKREKNLAAIREAIIENQQARTFRMNL